MKTLSEFKTLTEFTDFFHSEEVCVKHFTATRFADGEYCPHCNHREIYSFKGGKRYRCAGCKKDFTIRTGTLFGESKLPLRKWFMAIYLLSTTSKGMSSVQLAKHVGVTQKTAWFALDPDTKLVPCWFVGSRDASAAYHFMHDLKDRLANRVQLTTDGHKPYLAAVEDAFGADIDFAQLVKIYGNAPEGGEVRYSPAQCMGARKTVITGKPDHAHVSTSHTERQNLTMRMQMRRFTRLTNGFSKKLENHEAAIALHYMHYNFARVHQTLRVTPAMEAGISNHIWTIREIVDLLD